MISQSNSRKNNKRGCKAAKQRPKRGEHFYFFFSKAILITFLGQLQLQKNNNQLIKYN